jgi:hypothetical protein
VDLTAEQRALRDAVRTLLAREQRRAPDGIGLVEGDPDQGGASRGAAQLFGRPAEHVSRIAAALIDR